MTNEEKAQEIANNYYLNYEIALNAGFTSSYTECEKSAIEMAEWKDNQFISMLPDIFDFFVDNIGLYDGSCSHEDADKSWFIDKFTNKILGKK